MPQALPAPPIIWTVPCVTCRGSGRLALNRVVMPRTCPTCSGQGRTVHTPLTDPKVGIPQEMDP